MSGNNLNSWHCWKYWVLLNSFLSKSLSFVEYEQIYISKSTQRVPLSVSLGIHLAKFDLLSKTLSFIGCILSKSSMLKSQLKIIVLQCIVFEKFTIYFWLISIWLTVEKLEFCQTWTHMYVEMLITWASKTLRFVEFTLVEKINAQHSWNALVLNSVTPKF